MLSNYVRAVGHNTCGRTRRQDVPTGGPARCQAGGLRKGPVTGPALPCCTATTAPNVLPAAVPCRLASTTLSNNVACAAAAKVQPYVPAHRRQPGGRRKQIIVSSDSMCGRQTLAAVAHCCTRGGMPLLQGLGGRDRGATAKYIRHAASPHKTTMQEYNTW